MKDCWKFWFLMLQEEEQCVNKKHDEQNNFAALKFHSSILILKELKNTWLSAKCYVPTYFSKPVFVIPSYLARDIYFILVLIFPPLVLSLLLPQIYIEMAESSGVTKVLENIFSRDYIAMNKIWYVCYGKINTNTVFQRVYKIGLVFTYSWVNPFLFFSYTGAKLDALNREYCFL